MTGGKLLQWAHIQDDQVVASLQPAKQIRPGDRLESVPRAKVCLGQTADLSPTLGGDAAQVAPEVEHLRVAEFVVDAGTIPPAVDEADVT
jgi:hypothetical protein